MNPISTISTAIVIVLLAAGLVVGLSLAGIDLLNPWTSSAQAERISVETKHEVAMNTLQEQQKQAENEAYTRRQQILNDQQIQRGTADLAYQQQMNAFKIQMAAIFAEAGQIALMLISALVAVGLASIPIGFAVRLARSVPAAPAVPAEFADFQPGKSGLWNNPEYRAREIAKARQVELEKRSGKIVQPCLPKPIRMSSTFERHNNGGRRYKDLPLTGD